MELDSFYNAGDSFTRLRHLQREKTHMEVNPVNLPSALVTFKNIYPAGEHSTAHHTQPNHYYLHYLCVNRKRPFAGSQATIPRVSVSSLRPVKQVARSGTPMTQRRTLMRSRYKTCPPRGDNRGSTNARRVYRVCHFMGARYEA